MNNLNIETSDTLIKHIKSKTMEKAEQELKALFGKRYVLYRQQFDLAGELKYVPVFPLYVMLEQTYRCNMRCVTCIQGYPHLRKKFSFNLNCMPWNLYEKIILEGEKNKCPSVSMHTNDEPLLVKDLENRIAFARQHGFMDIIMTTNGMLFTEEKIKSVIDAGVTRILFSIDAATEETYSKIRLGGDFKKVLKVIKKVKKYRNSRKSNLPILRASFVANQLNQHELGLFLDRFSSLVDYVDVQPFCTYYDVNLELIPENARHISEYVFRCNAPYRHIVVRGNGDVLPCCSFYGTELVMGNVYHNTIKQIFNSPAMKQLRRELKEGNYCNPPCHECSRSTYEVSINNV